MNNLNQNHEINRENEWFAKRMTITTKEGMLRQYQLEEQERGYKIQNLEFKSPAYILKNFIYTNTHRPHKSLTGLRQLQGRNIIGATIGNIAYLARSGFTVTLDLLEREIAKVVPAPQARRLSVVAAFTILVTSGAVVAFAGQTLASGSGAGEQYIVTSSKIHTGKLRNNSISLHQKKFNRESGTL